MEELQLKLALVMEPAGVGTGPISGLIRLSGGANMESWSFDFAEQGFVLRRAPSAAFMEGRAFGHDVEAALVRAAVAAGVTAPSVVAELRSEDGLGTGYIMRRVEAEVSPAKILASPAPSLLDDIALELARIHAIQPRPDIAIPIMDTAAAVAELKSRFLFYGGDRPIIALALRWCETNMPAVVEPVLVHGDFRMGNLMADANGLAAVLDWELAHWGDAHEDLAYGCMAVWRFGHYHRPAFGLGSLDAYFAAYEKHSGSKVDWERFRFWLVYRTLWWALGCLQMTSIWRSGADRSLERAVIGRRTSENELDLLLLLEADAPEAQRRAVEFRDPVAIPAEGEPNAFELIEALREWIDTDIKSKATGRDRFLAAVAMNALSIIGREQSCPVSAQDTQLAEDLLSGAKDIRTPGLLSHLRSLALRKISVDGPKYASVAEARRLWCEDAG